MFSCIGTELEKKETMSHFDFEGLKDVFGLFFRKLDDLTANSFARNYGGHPRSDVALLNDQIDLTGVNAILARLDERKGDGYGSDVSDADIRLAFKSKYCQSASEMIKYYENLLEIRDNKALAQMEESERERAASDLKAKRESLRATLTADEKEYLRKAKRDKEIESLIDQ